MTITFGQAVQQTANTPGFFESIGVFIGSASFLIILGLVAFIGMAILLENELEGWATTLFSLATALVLWHFKSDIFGFVVSSPYQTIGFILSYITIGIIWSFIKWRSYVKNVFDKLKRIKDKFIAEYKEITESNKSMFISRVSDGNFRDSNGYKISIYSNDTLETIVEKIAPQAVYKKSIITSWIAYWPISLLATLLNDPFRKFFEGIYDAISGYYEKITISHKKDLLK